MKLVEALIGFAILVLVLVGGLNFLFLNTVNYDTYLTSIKKDSYKMSLYNYSDYLISKVSFYNSGYISYTNGNFQTGSLGDFAYECSLYTGNLINSNSAYTGVFCTINAYNEKIYKYKLLP